MTKILFILSLFLGGINSGPVDTLAPVIQSSTYHSTVTDKDLPYHFIQPKDGISAIFIYMHGAGGKYEQGMSDELFAGNFKALKTYLFQNHFLYVTPETSDFELSGAQEILDLVTQLKQTYTDLPVYLSGASAGGRTIFYALEEADKKQIQIDKFIFVCPAISASQVDGLKTDLKNKSIWIESGEKDAVMPPDTAAKLLKKFQDLGASVQLETIPNGDHNAPVEKIKWATALKFIN